VRATEFDYADFDYALPSEIDYALPSMEDSFSPLGNLVPGKAGMKGQRVAMASRWPWTCGCMS